MDDQEDDDDMDFMPATESSDDNEFFDIDEDAESDSQGLYHLKLF